MKHLSLSLLTFFLLFATNSSAQDLWGFTPQGGADNNGVIFKTDEFGNNFEVQYEFPTKYSFGFWEGSLTEVNGKFYGFNTGGIFEYDPQTKIYTTLTASVGTTFVDAKLTYYNGWLYGASYYTSIFKYNIDNDNLVILYDLTDDTGILGTRSPRSNLVEVNGKLYGSFSSLEAGVKGGVIELDPVTDLIQMKIADAVGVGFLAKNNGLIYGVTNGVEPYSYIYSYSPVTNVVDTLYTFNSASDGLAYYTTGVIEYNGFLYGATKWPEWLYKFEISTGIFTKVDIFDGVNSGAECLELTEHNGKIYGVTTKGGINDQGVLFEYDPLLDTYSKKVDFGGSIVGKQPLVGLLGSGDFLYGMTSLGGLSNEGTVFKYNLTTDTYTTEFSFNEKPKGANPGADLLAFDGKLYGLTPSGGAANNGVLFEFDTATNEVTVKVNFDGAAQGAKPEGSLMVFNNKLYGTTSTGGINNEGVIFSYEPSSNTFNKHLDMEAAVTGSTSYATLSEFNGKLYGHTFAGGANGVGTLFEFDPTNNTLTNKIDFDGVAKGRNPKGALILMGNTFYGMTTLGGDNNKGVLYSYAPETNTYNNLLNFDGTGNGANPDGALLLIDGIFYGTTTLGGVNDKGVVFSFNPSTNMFVKKADLTIGGASGSLIESQADFYALHGNLIKIDTVNFSSATKVVLSGANGQSPLGSLIKFGRNYQTLAFESIEDQNFDDGSYTLLAEATSGLAVQYEELSNSLLSISGSEVTFLVPGRASVKAIQPGDANFKSTESITQNFCINPAKPTIESIEENPLNFTLSSSSTINNQWYFNGSPIIDGINQTVLVEQEGDYSVDVLYDDCKSELSESYNVVFEPILGTEKNLELMGIYPNPSVDYVKINHLKFTQGASVKVFLYDESGKTVLKQHKKVEQKGLLELDISAIKSGIYFLKVQIKGEQPFEQRLMVQKSALK